ncbi:MULTISPECIES: hypothetical protein [unclassified Mycolicibacterium]|uniref:hypothetical protein n=2 Tax=Mycolicibacterium TaxID=1866885 RepID=UPI0012DD1835|nr:MULTISPECIES: hypothetical protein [unclassified Mycolicibacterium]MUL80345.1 hypothetical protein [Mycolicibacterium sp. CBMA 329]MUL86112.1 hypothetical protein [Mycolicibacterium sp. CBMA 331]MUM00886.1 hypothetical protein [Mycolicibacterium sp. CBMA 334]MUM36408.1 hypothetical protein [Mycolicibacterium sp. CBMA 247]MUM42176.1 hypothetical protein [Mycolicibacterium sp. CBMA 294]
MSYHVMDLVRERANERDWELIFDSGPNSDLRTIVWEHPCPEEAGQPVELEITFNIDGRVVQTEKRQDGQWCHRTTPTDEFASTDVHLETLSMI